ncbi:hypothetical protein MMC25_002628 [Agyrium rufum]|nr:hypothetical protein [Agyrium rufum]
MPPKVQPRPPPPRRSARSGPSAPSTAQAQSAPKEVVSESSFPLQITSPQDSDYEAPDSQPNPTAPQTESRAPTPVTRPRLPPTQASSARGSGPLKFKPKASYTRASRETREAQDKAQKERDDAARKAHEEAEAARKRALGSQAGPGRGGAGAVGGRGGRGGARGGISGWRMGEGRGSGASGPLAGGGAVEKGGKKWGRTALELGMERAEAGFGEDSAPGVVKKEDEAVGQAEATGVAAGKKGKKGKATKVKTEDSRVAGAVPDVMDVDMADADNEEGPRINIEHINLISDDESDIEAAMEVKAPGTAQDDRDRSARSETPNTLARRMRGWAMHPIRLDRAEHVERTIGVNTDASSSTSAELRRKAKEKAEKEGSLFFEDERGSGLAGTGKKKTRPKDVEVVGDKRVWKGVYQDEDDGVKVKSEPVDEDVVLPDAPRTEEEVDQRPQSTSSVAETRAAQTIDPADALRQLSRLKIRYTFKKRRESDVDAKPNLQDHRRGSTSYRKAKPILQTPEDKEEWARHENDNRLLTEELGIVKGSSTKPKSGKSKTDLFDPVAASIQGQDPALLESDTRHESTGNTQELTSQEIGDQQKADRRADLVYVVQLPSIMPRLMDRAREKAEKESLRVKAEAEAEERRLTAGGEPDVVETDAPASSSKGQASKGVGSTAAQAKKAGTSAPGSSQAAKTAPGPQPQQVAAQQQASLDQLALTAVGMLSNNRTSSGSEFHPIKVESSSISAAVSSSSDAKPIKSKNAARQDGCLGTLTLRSNASVILNWGGVKIKIMRGSEGGGLQEVLGSGGHGSGGSDGATGEIEGVAKKEEGEEDVEMRDAAPEKARLGKVKEIEKTWNVGQLAGGFVGVPDLEGLL